MDFEAYMREAITLAEAALAAGEVPVGCVIADAAGVIVSRGQNTRERSRSALGHAELFAIDEACRARGDWRLDDCTLFVTLEPCPMCAGAIINARVGRVVFGAREARDLPGGQDIDGMVTGVAESLKIVRGIIKTPEHQGRL